VLKARRISTAGVSLPPTAVAPKTLLVRNPLYEHSSTQSDHIASDLYDQEASDANRKCPMVDWSEEHDFDLGVDDLTHLIELCSIALRVILTILVKAVPFLTLLRMWA
jgi:hypothetical protein